MSLLNDFLSHLGTAFILVASTIVAYLWARNKESQKEIKILKEEKLHAELDLIIDRTKSEPLEQLVSESNADYAARKNTSDK